MRITVISLLIVAFALPAQAETITPDNPLLKAAATNAASKEQLQRMQKFGQAMQDCSKKAGGPEAMKKMQQRAEEQRAATEKLCAAGKRDAAAALAKKQAEAAKADPVNEKFRQCFEQASKGFKPEKPAKEMHICDLYAKMKGTK